MYNTLKEIQEALPVEDLNKLANKVVGKKAEEIVEIFKKDNIDISIDAANECVEYLKRINIVVDEELDNVTGGCGGSKPTPKYQVDQRLKRYYNVTQNYSYFTVKSIGGYDSYNGSYVYKTLYDGKETERTEYLDSDSNVSPA